MGKLRDGALFAPNYIENKLKFFPHIKEAVAFGDGRDKVCAFINIDIDGGRQLGRAARPAYAGYADLAAKPEVYELIRECVEKVNADLAADDELAGSQVQPLPDPAQGARPRRRRADAHAQGAPRLHRREVRACWSTRCTAAGRASTSRRR